MEERRRINRIEYKAKGVLVLCDTQKRYIIETDNISPLGMAIRISEDIEDVIGKRAIIITPTMIMYVEIVRKETLTDNSFLLGLHAINFTEEVFQYIASSIGNN